MSATAATIYKEHSMHTALVLIVSSYAVAHKLVR
jgi:hypothetical protein